MTLGISKGLVPTGYMDGSPWTNKFNYYKIAGGYNTDIYKYDLVYRLPNASGYIGKYTAANVSANNGTAAVGVFIGCLYFLPGSQSSLLSATPSNFWPAGQVIKPGTEVLAMVIDDPAVIYSVTANGTPNFNQMGGNANFADTGGDIVSGLSGLVLDVGTISKTTSSNASGLGTLTGTTPVIIPATYINGNSVITLTPQAPIAGGLTITKQNGVSFTVVSSNNADTAVFAYTISSGLSDNSYLPLKLIGATPITPFDPLTQNGTAGMNINCIINNHAYKRGTQGA